MHIPVLLGEAIEGLNISKGAVIVDATLGSGGHSKEILKKLQEGKLIVIDIDDEAISECRDELERIAKENKNEIFFINNNFSRLEEILGGLGIEKVDGVLADLGWRIDQVENEKYGMSFKKDGPLDMRLGNKETGKNAKEIINNWNSRQLEEIFRNYGEERYARQAVGAIIEKRREKEIETTGQLAGIIKESIGRHYGRSKIHPATRIFQALRIEVNSEIENLRIFLAKALEHLKKGGRLAIISFHSLEDREVKKFFQANARGCICPKGAPVCFCQREAKIKIITKKPIIPSSKELEDNPRSRSAKLRIAEKI